MKARVKATGEIVEVSQGIYSPYQYVDNEGTIYTENDVEELPGDDGAIFFNTTIDYWTRLEHQYAGMAMQGILSNQDYCKLLIDENNKGSFAEDVSRCASELAHALVEKLKEKEERK